MCLDRFYDDINLTLSGLSFQIKVRPGGFAIFWPSKDKNLLNFWNHAHADRADWSFEEGRLDQKTIGWQDHQW